MSEQSKYPDDQGRTSGQGRRRDAGNSSGRSSGNASRRTTSDSAGETSGRSAGKRENTSRRTAADDVRRSASPRTTKSGSETTSKTKRKSSGNTRSGTEKNPQGSPGAKKKSKVMDALLTLVLFAAIGLFAFAAFNLYHIYTEYKKGSDEYNAIAEMAVTERKPDNTAASSPGGQAREIQSPMSIDFNALKAINDDVIGWIYVEAFEGINYPIVRGLDNSYYLHRTYQRNYNFAGTIFNDAQNHDDYSDCNTIVYGHNMKNGSMFGMLRHFSSDPEAYARSKYFWIFTPEADYRYEIISAYVTGVYSDTYTFFKGPGQDFVDWMNSQVSHSEIATTPGELNVKDKIVTLSTCTGDDSTRYVVQGKRVNVIKK